MSASTFLSSPISILARLLQPLISLLNFLHYLSHTLFIFLNQLSQSMSSKFQRISSTSSLTSTISSQGATSDKSVQVTRISEIQVRVLRGFEVLIEWVEWVGRVGFIGVLLACAPVGWTLYWVGCILKGIRWILNGSWWEQVRVWIGLVDVEKLLGQVSDSIGGAIGKGERRRKTLVLDLDETLVHSKFKDGDRFDLHLQIMVDQFPTSFYVSKRPYLDVFLRTAAQWYNVVIFTASLKKYADPLINILDPNGLVCGRYFRESCAKQAGNFVKDLRVVEPNLSDILIVDNSSSAYSMHSANAVPIEAWYDDPGDEELLNLLPLLHAIAPLKDVRSLLALRLSGGVLAAKSSSANKYRGAR